MLGFSLSVAAACLCSVRADVSFYDTVQGGSGDGGDTRLYDWEYPKSKWMAGSVRRTCRCSRQTTFICWGIEGLFERFPALGLRLTHALLFRDGQQTTIRLRSECIPLAWGVGTRGISCVNHLLGVGRTVLGCTKVPHSLGSRRPAFHLSCRLTGIVRK